MKIQIPIPGYEQYHCEAWAFPWNKMRQCKLCYIVTLTLTMFALHQLAQYLVVQEGTCLDVFILEFVLICHQNLTKNLVLALLKTALTLLTSLYHIGSISISHSVAFDI